jgi:acyl transferase domain-containing protein
LAKPVREERAALVVSDRAVAAATTSVTLAPIKQLTGTAIVGASCRLPGGANSAEEFWALVRDGVFTATEIPKSRIDWTDLYDPEPGVPKKIYVKRWTMIEGIDLFDAAFFGIPPAEATYIDPQQRMLLEESWTSLETAGVNPVLLQGARVGVFAGSCTSDYSRIAVSSPSPYAITGGSQSALGGRISFCLGLQGPSITVDTACSSSLVATSLAIDALAKRECHIALIGGAQANIGEGVIQALCQMRALAPDGCCKTFDAAANGYVRGEGAAVLVAMRLADAISEGRRVMAVVLGAAVNHDGRSSGFTTPNGPA